jgi:hypothetical protein
MDKRLRNLFDFQKFEQNAELQSVIDRVHARYSARMLSDDEADQVFAAGSPDMAYLRKDPQKDDPK